MAQSKKRRRQRSRPKKVSRPLPANPMAILLDPEDKKLIIFTSDMLINQLRRDGPRIEASFDKLCGKELQELSHLFSTTGTLLYTGLRVASKHNQEQRGACAELLINASNSFVSAVSLLRMGYVLQPGIVIRSLLEAVSTVFHLMQHPKDFDAYKRHALPSPSTIKAAKNALPPFGNLYGQFSDNFAHIGHLHKSINRVSEYKEVDDSLEVNLSFLRMSAWLLYVTTELLFNDLLDEPRYWQPVPNGYAYSPSQEERNWMSTFFRLNDAT